MEFLLWVVLAFTLSFAALNAAICDPATSVPYVGQAETLVQSLQHAALNVYGGGRREIQWEPADCSARTVCSSFIIRGLRSLIVGRPHLAV